MQLIPTIYFNGVCHDAVSFYRDTLGAEVLFHLTVSDVVAAEQIKPGTENKVLRAGLRVGDTLIYLADGHRPGPLDFKGFSLTLRLPRQEDAERALQLLAVEGTVQIPVRPTAWADAFGAVIDKYGVHWVMEAGVRGPIGEAG